MTRRIRILAAIVVLAIIALAASAPAASHTLATDLWPDNDAFASPRSLWGAGSLPWTETQSTGGATLEAGETAPCGAVGATVWYAYMSSQSAIIEVSTAGSDFDTIVTVYTSGDDFLPSPPGGGLRSLVCNDDSSDRTSLVTFTSERDKAYYIQAGGKDGATGALNVSVRCVPYCRPDFDDFSAAASAYVSAYSPQTTLTATTEHATLEAGEPKPCGNIGATTWFHLVMESASTVAVDTAGSDFDTVLAAYAPPTTFIPSPPGSLSLSDCNDDSGGVQQSRLVVDTWPVSDYWFQVGGKDGATGNVTINFACDPACPPGNNDIARAYGTGAPMEEITHTEAATTEPREPQPCGRIGRTVWYEIVLGGDATVVIDTAGSSFDTVLAVYTRDDVDGERIVGQHVACSVGAPGAAAHVEFAASAMTSYLIQAGGRDGASGELHIAMNCGTRSCPPYNDAMSNYGYLYPGMTEFIDTSGATVEEGEPRGCGELTATAWYVLQSPAGGRMRLSASDSDHAAAVGVYRQRTDIAEPALTVVACGDASQPDIVEFDAEPESSGWQYLVQVGSRSGGGGMLQLRAECVASCPEYVSPSSPDTGDGVVESGGGAAGPITLPNTGSGG